MAHEDCKHEKDFGSMSSDIKSLLKRMDKTEKETKENTEHIQDLKQNKASTDEKFTRVFELLGELKDSIGKIQVALEKKNERLPTLLYTIAGVVVGGSISGVIVWIVTK